MPLSVFEQKLFDSISLEPQYETTIGENYQVGRDQEAREFLPMASRRNMTSALDQEVEKIALQHLELGMLNNSEIQSYKRMGGNMDTEGMLVYMNDLGIPTGIDVDELLLERQTEYDAMRAEDQFVFDRQSFGGAVGEMAGRFAATFTDEVYLATLPLGVGASNSILGAAVRTAILNGLIQTGAEPFIMDFQTEIGGDYGYDKAAKHVAFAAGGGFVLGAGGKALEKLLPKRAAKTLAAEVAGAKNMTQENIQAMRAVSQKSQAAEIHVDAGAVKPDVEVNSLEVQGQQIVDDYQKTSSTSMDEKPKGKAKKTKKKKPTKAQAQATAQAKAEEDALAMFGGGEESPIQEFLKLDTSEKALLTSQKAPECV